MVLLRIWNSGKHGGGGWGHSSLEVGGRPPAGIYISWWPGDLKGNLPAVFAENMTLEQDINKLEKRQPNAVFQIHELDERAIKVWWMKWRGSSYMYRVAGQNCSSVVAKALQEGGSERFAKVMKWDSTPVIWTPFTLAAYARAIQAGQAAMSRFAAS